MAVVNGVSPINGGRPGVGELAVQRCGPHLLIRHRDELPWEMSILRASLFPRGDVVVLASAAAHRSSALSGVLCSVLPQVFALDWRFGGQTGAIPSIKRVWVAVSGIGVEGGSWSVWLRWLAEYFRVEVLAPHGQLTLVPGGTLFVGAVPGRTGWLRYQPGTANALRTTRCPMPGWDAALPKTPLVAAGLRAEPVPAGLLVRDARAPVLTVDDPAFMVPVHGQHPKLILGRVGALDPAPEAVAALVGELPAAARDELLVVPAGGPPMSSTWVGSLAGRLGFGVLLSTGTPLIDQHGATQTIVLDEHGNQLFRPFATVLRAVPGKSTVDVMEIGPPPAGWSRWGPRQYRPDGADSTVRADVVPSGLLLRHRSTGGADTAAPVDPLHWTVHLGVTGETVTGVLLAGLEQLLAGLSADRLRTARVRVAGALGDPDRDQPRLRALAARCGVPVDLPGDLNPEPVTASVRAQGSPLAEAGPTERIAPVDAMAGLRPSTVSAPQVVTIADPPAAETGETEAIDKLIPAHRSRHCPKPRRRLSRQRRTGARRKPRRTARARSRSRRDSSSGPPRISPTPSAVVNAALATWPALRQQDLRGAKADYVAVCLYLRNARLGGAALNAALRAGRPVPGDGFLPCLVSGLRRLPTVRRPVVRHGRLDLPAQRHYPVGALLTEHGFLSASVTLDVLTAEANVDFLIWPRLARGTSVLGLGGPVEEAVFAAGARFKVLAVRTAAGERDDSGEPAAPDSAVLLRELLPYEDYAGSELDSADSDVLARLDRVLARRRGSPVRLLDDPETVARVAGSLPGMPDVPALRPGAADRGAR